ncbi:MAG: 5'-nucleotidase C-terminal domain-containing protein [Bacteroidia bacterium]|nr:5'-nucleotidase C-terminal domain-containing protein [Bacteroidia bacterium]
MKYKGFLLLAFSISCIACSTVKPYAYESKGFLTPGNSGLVEEDSVLIREIDPYKSKMLEIMSEILAVSAQPLEKGQPESLLGNFVADACYERANLVISEQGKLKADFCVLNNGGLRSALPQGNITLKNCFELMPFENELVMLTLSAQSTQDLLNYIASKGGVPVSNLQMKISGSTAESVLIDGKPVDYKKEYFVLTSDYLANGGDDMKMFQNPIAIEKTGLKVRDAIVEHLRSLPKQPFTAKADGRISR